MAGQRSGSTSSSSLFGPPRLRHLSGTGAHSSARQGPSAITTRSSLVVTARVSRALVNPSLYISTCKQLGLCHMMGSRYIRASNMSSTHRLLHTQSIHSVLHTCHFLTHTYLHTHIYIYSIHSILHISYFLTLHVHV